MSAGKHNITIDQGATFSMRLTVKDDGSAMNLTSPQYAARGQLRLTAENSTAVAFTCEGSGGGALLSDGIIDVSLTAAQTDDIAAGRYVYDIEIFTGSNNDGIVTRLIQGSAEVTREITR